MKTININGNIICYDSYSLEQKPELQDFIKEDNLEQFLEKIKQKVILILGGDGTMLRAIRENYKRDIAFLGLNFGSKGFLLNDKNYIGKNNFISRTYPLLEIKKESKNIAIAINDVNIYSPEGKVVDININLNDKNKTNIKGDGVIISTPAGSTGHNSSYDGPILPHTSSHLIITPKGTISPHSSKVVDGENSIFIENTGRKNPIGINADGNQIFIGNDVSIEIKKSKKTVEFLILEDYVEKWDNKVLWEQGFKI